MKKILIVLSLLLCGSSYAIDINIPVISKVFLPRTYQITFYNGTNTNYQYGKGILIITQKEELATPEILSYTYNGKSYSITCSSQIKGYYVDLLFGNVVFGLSKDNENFLKRLDGNRNITITGGLYTNCAGNGLLSDAIVGYVLYKKDGQNILSLYAGYTYDVGTNAVKFEEGFKNSLRYVNGIKLIGYINSTIGGIGLVGVDAGSSLSKINQSLSNIDKGLVLSAENKVSIGGEEFNLLDLNVGVLSSIGVKGLSSLSMGNVSNKKEIIQGLTLETDSKIDKQTRRGSVVLNSKLNFGKVKNIVKKRAMMLCRGKWLDIKNDIEYTENNRLDKINCFRDVGNNPVKVIINYDVSRYNKDTIIIGGEGVNVVFKKPMRGKGFVEMYLDGGNLMIDKNIDLVPLSANLTAVTSQAVTSGVVLRGNFIINGLIGGYDGNLTNFGHKLFVLGSLGSLNTIMEPNQSRIELVEDVVGIGDPNKISLTKVFNWYCKENGIGSDGVNCSSEEDKWRFNSLIIEKKYYNGLLLR